MGRPSGAQGVEFPGLKTLVVPTLWASSIVQPREGSMRRKVCGLLAIAALVLAVVPAAAAEKPTNPNCFGKGASQLGQAGEMGEHSSSFPRAACRDRQCGGRRHGNASAGTTWRSPGRGLRLGEEFSPSQRRAPQGALRFSTQPLFERGQLVQAVGTQDGGFAQTLGGIPIITDANVTTTASRLRTRSISSPRRTSSCSRDRSRPACGTTLGRATGSSA